jgi:DNA-binding transcriptional ArsR family regulator
VSYHLRFSSRDLLRCRFAISPIFETMGAARALHDTKAHPYHRPWLREVADRVAGLDLGPLHALQPIRGETPDFLSPTTGAPAATIEEGLELVRTADPAVVAAELTRTLADQGGPAERAHITRMIEDPAAARHLLADLLGQCWTALVEPYWPRLSDLLQADIVHNSRLLAEGGLARLIPELHERLSWRDDTLIMRTDLLDVDADLEGDGLLLVPGAFHWPHALLRIQRPYQPAIVYPVRGIGRLWSRPAEASDALGRLIGRTRARLLADLAEPAATITLAGRHRLSPATVSAHLAALRDTGLVTARRHRHQVLYQSTALGGALLEGQE